MIWNYVLHFGNWNCVVQVMTNQYILNSKLCLVDIDINISVLLSHVINIGSVLYILFTLRSSPFITDWRPDDFICLDGGCACGSICCNAACSSISRHIRLSTGLFTGSSCSPTLLLSTRTWIRGWILPVITPLHRGVFNQSSNILGNKVSSLVINLQVRDTTDCLSFLMKRCTFLNVIE